MREDEPEELIEPLPGMQRFSVKISFFEFLTYTVDSLLFEWTFLLRRELLTFFELQRHSDYVEIWFRESQLQ